MLKTKKMLQEYVETLKNEENSKTMDSFSSAPCFSVLLDQIDCSDLIVLAGRPGMGKTSWALSFSLELLKNKKKIVFFSLELSSVQVIERIFANVSGIPLVKIRKNLLETREKQRIEEALNVLKNYELSICDQPRASILEIKKQIKELAKEQKRDLIVIDYLQLVSSIGSNPEYRYQEISNITRELKILAREIETPILLLSQLSRSVEGRSDKRPMLSDLRDSGTIEEDADKILFLYRSDYYNPETEDAGIAEIIVAKNRTNDTFTKRMRFFHELLRFVSHSTKE